MTLKWSWPMTVKLIPLCATVTFALITQQAMAHATWIAQQNGVYAIVHGEGSATNEAIDPMIVSRPLGFDKAGEPIAVTLVATQTSVALAGTDGAAVLTAVYAEGWWTEDANGEWHNAKPDGFADFKSAGQYFTYPVAYVGSVETVGTPVGNPLEIIPLADPTVLTMGDKLEVQVLQDGQPLEGVVVTLDVLTDWDLSSPATDAEGKTLVTVQNNGLNVLQIYAEKQVGEKELLGQQAVLSFVAHGPAVE
jgi:nickel transport protein